MDPGSFDSQVMLITGTHAKCIRCILLRRHADNYPVCLIPSGLIKTLSRRSLITYRQLSTKLLSSAGPCWSERESELGGWDGHLSAQLVLTTEERSLCRVGLIAKCVFELDLLKTDRTPAPRCK